MNSFQDTPITNLATGHTFLHRSYCASPKEAADFARLTFTNPAVFVVGQAGDAAVAALEYSEGWKPPEEIRTDLLPVTGRIQTELF